MTNKRSRYYATHMRCQIADLAAVRDLGTSQYFSGLLLGSVLSAEWPQAALHSLEGVCTAIHARRVRAALCRSGTACCAWARGLLRWPYLALPVLTASMCFTERDYHGPLHRRERLSFVFTVKVLRTLSEYVIPCPGPPLASLVDKHSELGIFPLSLVFAN